jgi:hypothetical protein
LARQPIQQRRQHRRNACRIHRERADGNVKRGVTIREVNPVLVVSRERYAEQSMMYASLTHRQDCQVVDSSALAVLQQHA